MWKRNVHFVYTLVHICIWCVSMSTCMCICCLCVSMNTCTCWWTVLIIYKPVYRYIQLNNIILTSHIEWWIYTDNEMISYINCNFICFRNYHKYNFSLQNAEWLSTAFFECIKNYLVVILTYKIWYIIFFL